MFKGVLIIIILTFAAIFTFSFFSAEKDSPSYQTTQTITVEKKAITIGDKKLSVEIADESHEQTKGLSGKVALDDNEGMLFIFPQPEIPGFWMKEMNFPIDIIWIDATGIVIGIEKNLSPDTFPKTFSPASPIKYVLEVNSGWSDRNKTKIGDKITGH